MKYVIGFCLLFLLLVPHFSCTHEIQGLEGIDTVCFQTQVLPIIQSSCGTSGCHSGNGEEFALTNYDEIRSHVEPGYAHRSEIYRAITSKWINPMPPNGALSEEARTLIRVWIDQGAKNTTCTPKSGTTVTYPPASMLDTICFNQVILPIISSSCGKTGCHNATTAKEGYVLTSYSSIMSKSGFVVPGNYSQSKLYRVITQSGEDRMPPDKPLTPTQISAIKQWISEGALNSDCPSLACDTAGTISFSNQVWPVISTYCAGCHPATGTGDGGVNLGNYSQIKAKATTKVNNISLLVGVTRQLPGFKPMPPSGKLDACKLRTIEKWIEQGCVQN